jgi:hypothetical protein
MPPDTRHTQKAIRNEQFASELDTANPVKESWAVIAVFYSALHYVQSVLQTSGVDDAFNHKRRAEEIARDPILKYIAGPYDWLQKLSELARYKCKPLPGKAYTDAKARLEAVKKQVEKVT